MYKGSHIEEMSKYFLISDMNTSRVDCEGCDIAVGEDLLPFLQLVHHHNGFSRISLHVLALVFKNS